MTESTSLTPHMRSELDQPWAIGTAGFLAVKSVLDDLQPLNRILEFGAGASTRALAACYPTAEIQAVEHQEEFVPHIPESDGHRVRVAIAPLKVRLIEGALCHTYRYSPDSVFDAVLVDGPPAAYANGRLGALLLGFRSLRLGGVMILDDAHRHSELRAASDYIRIARGSLRFVEVGHGLIIFVKTVAKTRRQASALANVNFMYRLISRSVRIPKS